MRAVSSLAAVAIGLSAVWVIASATDGNTTISAQGSDFAHRSAVLYRMSSVEAGASCIVKKLADTEASAALIALEPSCETLLPGIAEAHAWHEQRDGSVELVTRTGAALVSFSVGDDVDFESYAPRRPLLSLAELD